MASKHGIIPLHLYFILILTQTAPIHFPPPFRYTENKETIMRLLQQEEYKDPKKLLPIPFGDEILSIADAITILPQACLLPKSSTPLPNFISYIQY